MMVKPKTTFCALACKWVRLGNYEVVPRGRLLTTENFIQMKVRRITGRQEYVTIELSLEEVVNVLFYCGSSLAVLFLFISPPCCSRVRLLLGMRSRHGLFLDNCAGQDDSQKRVTILMERITAEDITILKSQLQNKLHEIPYENASNIMQTSKPKDFPQESQELYFILQVKKSFTSDLLFLVWQEAVDNCNIKLKVAFLEKSRNRTSWKLYEKKWFEGISADSPQCAKYQPARGEGGMVAFRVRMLDLVDREYFTNVVFIHI